MADALDSKSSGGKPRVGSSPTSGILREKDLRHHVVSPFFFHSIPPRNRN